MIRNGRRVPFAKQEQRMRSFMKFQYLMMISSERQTGISSVPGFGMAPLGPLHAGQVARPVS